MKKSNEAMEIEQLKSKIEKYRKALSTLKAQNPSEDIHLKRRVRTLEENVEQLNVQVQEFATMFDEGVTYLINEIEQLANKLNEHVIGKKETAKPRKEPVRIEQNEHPSNLSIQSDDQSARQQSTIPSFKQMRQLAALHPAVQPNEPPKSTRYNAPAALTETSGLRERKPIARDEVNLPNKGESSVTSTSRSDDQVTRTLQESEKPQSVQPPTQLYAREDIQETSFWKKFKKK